MTGGCACKGVRYRLNAAPMFVNCCHCTWCQRETGSAFVMNAIIERDQVEILSGTPELTDTPSASGAGQLIARCPTCRMALWSHFGRDRPRVAAFVRVGTLDDARAVAPDAHVFTSTMVPWLTLPADAQVFDAYYNTREQWPAASLERWGAMMARASAP